MHADAAVGRGGARARVRAPRADRATSLADLGVSLRRETPGQHRAACPRCAGRKRRPGDGALAVRLGPDGTGVFYCHRCGWSGLLRPGEGSLDRRSASALAALRGLKRWGHGSELFSCPPEGVRPAGDETGAISPTRFLSSCPPEGVRPAGDETGAASPTRFLTSCPPEGVRPAGDENGAASPTRFLTRPGTRPSMAPGEAAAPPQSPAAAPEWPAVGLSPAARRLWDSRSLLTAGSPPARYFRGRGCELPPNDVGWHPALPHPCGYVGPCILALVTDVLSGEPVSIQRTWLAADGSGKAPVGRPRSAGPGCS